MLQKIPVPPRQDFESRYEALIAAEKLSPDSGQKLAAASFQRLHDDLLEMSHQRARGWLFRHAFTQAPRGLYLYGGVGRGKSMLMDLFFATAPVGRKRRVHFHAFMLETHAALDEARRRGQSDILAAVASDIAAKTKLLCFDEFFVRDVADAMILGRLFTALLNEGLVLVATSNVAPDDLYRDGLQRSRFLPFIDLLKDKLEILSIGGGEDYRRLRPLALRSWQVPISPDTTRELRRIFRLLAGAEGAPGALQLEGRGLNVPLAANDVAWFEFDGLCGTATGVADYIAITKKYDTLCLNAVPRFRLQQRNEAVRFILLIDTLYEAGTKLFATAEAMPDQLYEAGEHAFEFARTASRLAEMQTEDYLHRKKDGGNK